MSTRLSVYMLLITSWCLSSAAQALPADNFTLLSRSSAGHLEVTLDKSQRHWLEEKRALILGTSAPDYPPFDMTSSGQDYEGFTADYAGILSRTLDIPIRVKRFASRAEAIDALESGDIDLLGTANGFEAENSAIVLSSPYAVDQPVLVTRESEKRSLTDGLQGLRLSMVYHYLPLDIVKTLYPNAILQTYPSSQNAINAVAFDQADVFLGDTLSTHYLINKGYLKNIKMANFGKHEAHGFSFAVNSGNPQLLALINTTLKAIPVSERESISKRWSAGSDILLTDHKLQLTDREQRWLTRHPVVRVVVNDTLSPLTFFDTQGNFLGITSDLLELIRLRTGMRFEVQRSRSLSDMINQVEQGKADIIGAISPTIERESRLNFSRSYLENSFVLVTRKDPNSPISLEQMTGKRLAITQGNPLITYLRREYPQVTLIETNDTFQGAQLLAQGQVEGAVNSLVVANDFISSPVFENKLQISATLGTQQAIFSLATARGATELGSILDKALLSVSPEELGVINSRWRGYTPANDSYWRNHSRLIYQIVIGAGLLLLLSLSWNAYMRRQIKQRQMAERALNDQFEFMRALVNETPHPIYVRDREGRLQTCNDVYLKAFARNGEDVIGKSVLEGPLDNEPEARQFAEDYQRVMNEGVPLITDRPLHIGDRELTIYHWILPYRDSLGEVKGVIGGWIDISERRQLVEELRMAKELADDANRAKSTFLATMSHEIRTPMNAVIGMLELTLKRADQGQLDRPAIEVAYNSARDLLELIGDILDIARIESGRLNLTPERVNLRDAVESVVRVFDGLARQKTLSLVLEVAPDSVTDDVQIDPLRFKQILSNLISNAIKFTDRGEVKVKLTLQPTALPNQLQLTLIVQDSGIGINAEDQRRLFEPFAQADNSGQLARSGAGLGLVICRSLCEMMGGVLTLRSEPGVGTEIHVSMLLPRLQPALAVAAVQPPAPAILCPLNVLVVDDHPANRLLMCQQLEFLGHQCAVAVNGQAGLEAWLGGTFDLVIADCNMPVMNGYELTQAIRQHEAQHQRPHCPVFGFTANAQPEERARCLLAGMDECLFKPISLTALNKHLAEMTPLTPTLLYDLDGLTPFTGGDKGMVQLLLDELIKANRLDLEQLQNLPRYAQLQPFADLAHKIRGAARIIRATRLIEQCEALEQSCNEGAPTATLDARREAVAETLMALDKQLTGLPGKVGPA